MQLGFGAGILYGIQTQDATGTAVANGTPVQFGALQDISADISFEEKMLYGAYQMPIAVGRGKGKFSLKAKTANIMGTVFSDLFFGAGGSNSIKDVVANFAASVPASTPWQVTIAPPNSGTFVSDYGVLNANTGLPLKKVATGPAAGQYSVTAGGVYTFASADANTPVLISYEYSATSTSARVVTMTNQLMGYAPTFKCALDTAFGGKSLTLVLNSCVSTKLSLPFKNDDFMVPEFEFSAFADAAGNIGYIASSE